MNTFKIGRLNDAVQKIQKRFSTQKALILMYHRIAKVDFDPWCLCVTPEHFAEQLEVLTKYAQPISLKQFVQAHQDGNIPERAVVVTFDDGYADNLYHAKPILERYDIPATIFVTTGYIGGEREFWWDELERLLLQPTNLPEKLSLSINGQIHQWDVGQAANYSQKDYLRDSKFDPWKAKPNSRLFFFYCVWDKMRSLSETEQFRILKDIQSWSNSQQNLSQSYRPLSPEELIALGADNLIEIGAHTVTHPCLSEHSETVQKNEIQESKIFLENLLNYPITSFSYPFGNRSDQTVELARTLGFDCACSTVEDSAWQKSDPFQLPRFAVKNWNGEKFAKQLSRWFYA